MRGDDLAPLLGAPPAAGVGYRQGTVRAWNPTTAENVIDVDGVEFENLTILNTSEALLLVPGDVVGILTTGQAASSWTILGRLTIPGTDAAASSLRVVSNRIVAATEAAEGTRSSNVYGDLAGAGVNPGPSVQMTVGQSGKALAFFAAEFGYTGAWESIVNSGVSVEVSGATSVAASQVFSLAAHFEKSDDGPSFSLVSQGASMHLFTGLNPGSHTFKMMYRSVSGQAVRFAQREICVFAL